jgi:hypothetical protein
LTIKRKAEAATSLVVSFVLDLLDAFDPNPNLFGDVSWLVEKREPKLQHADVTVD